MQAGIGKMAWGAAWLLLAAGECRALNLVDGKVGKAIEFQAGGREQKLEDFLKAPLLELKGDFTISAWVRLSAPIDGADAVLGMTGGGTSLDFAGGRLRLSAGADGDRLVATRPASPGTWLHLAVTRTGPALRLHLDGVADAQGSWSGTFSIQYLAAGNAGFLVGALDDVRIYGRALTQAEIGALARAEAASPSLAQGLLRHHPLDRIQEAFQRDPIDSRFPFSPHWMAKFSDDPSFVSMSSLTDLDRDGDLDFASGQRQDIGGGMNWYEYRGPDDWVRHFVGKGHLSAAGGTAMDVDRDGWVDLLAGDSWYRNPRTPRQSEWTRFPTGTPGSEEITVGDIDGDGRMDALHLWYSLIPAWYKPGPDPTAPWIKGAGFGYANFNQGGTLADLDGDGKTDLVTGDKWVFLNPKGTGAAADLVAKPLVSGFDHAPLTHAADLDGDGDVDMLMVTHFGPRVAWAENLDGKAGGWALHFIGGGKRNLHSVVGADFDNDGDQDFYAGENIGTAWIFENLDGKGNFHEHAVAENVRGHQARVGDVDCDGDLDIVGKPWEGGDHVYLRNMLVEKGGPRLFRRTAYETGPKIQDRACPDPTGLILPPHARPRLARARPAGPLLSRDGTRLFAVPSPGFAAEGGPQGLYLLDGRRIGRPAVPILDGNASRKPVK